ncbi:MAG TPA: crosslink repair DNA glycosylase YcaQ family protein [Ktedonosporobacter sp.]|nr:crosslink repair DNA glycosylase YcaQ family protein [Ktedonosporobacter sp.]
MAIPLSNYQVRLLRLRAQLLIPQQHEIVPDVARIVEDVCGIQAQDAAAARLAIRARSTRWTAADVEQAQVQDRTIIRTWGQRGTLHLLATKDLGWLLPLYGPIFIASDQRRRLELGLD